MNATVPLQDALPWSPDSCRNILVTDSIETDGRFVPYTMATQALQTQHAVWWLTASPITDQQVAMSLKKMGCDAAASYLRASTLGSAARTSTASPPASSKRLLQITTCATDWALQVMAGDPTVSPENYLKQLYRSMQTWLTQQNTDDDKPAWIVLDDLSSMATLLNDSGVVYRFVDSLVDLSNRFAGSQSSFGLILRCSNTPDSMEAASSIMSEDAPSVEDRVGWIGAGGLAGRRQDDHSAPWEHVLDECVDAIVDVVPLTGGYSREAHGRLVFTEYPGGRGWKDVSMTATSTARPASASWQPSVMNYCILDQGVRAIRLHQKAAPASS